MKNKKYQSLEGALKMRPNICHRIAHPIKDILGGLKYKVEGTEDTFENYKRKFPYVIPCWAKNQSLVRTIRDVECEGNLLWKNITVYFQEGGKMIYEGIGIFKAKKIVEYIKQMKKEQRNITLNGGLS